MHTPALIWCCLFAFVAAHPTALQPQSDPIETALKLFESRYQDTIAALGDAHYNDYPGITTQQNNSSTLPNFIWKFPNDWTLGFFSQILWQLGNLTEQSVLLEAASKWTAGIAPKAEDISTHDVGFMVFGSFGNGVLYGGKGSDYSDIVVQAAHTLAKRYNPTVGMTRSWGSIDDKANFLVIVDNMMNLELLMWAGLHSHNTTLQTIAISHALKTMDLFVRDNGSANHICNFNQSTGQLLAPCYTPELPTAVNATWARAQAWAIYGFTMMFRYTQDTRFLSTAIRMAEYTIATNPIDGIPYWVMEYNQTPENKDTSAAAITASALLELARFTVEPKYREYAGTIMTSMAQSFLAADSEAVFRANIKDCKVDGCSYIVTEAYFVEALRRWFGNF